MSGGVWERFQRSLPVGRVRPPGRSGSYRFGRASLPRRPESAPMPAFEVLPPGSDAPVRLRAAAAADALRRALDLPPDAAVALDPPEAGSGWQTATADGRAAGRVRPQNRMRFRRD